MNKTNKWYKLYWENNFIESNEETLDVATI